MVHSSRPLVKGTLRIVALVLLVHSTGMLLDLIPRQVFRVDGLDKGHGVCCGTVSDDGLVVGGSLVDLLHMGSHHHLIIIRRPLRRVLRQTAIPRRLLPREPLYLPLNSVHVKVVLTVACHTVRHCIGAVISLAEAGARRTVQHEIVGCREAQLVLIGAGAGAPCATQIN